MEERLDRDEVAILIQGRKILKAKGLSKDVDVKRICEAAGVSRKTGYQWAGKLEERSDDEGSDLNDELKRLRAEHEELEKRYDDVRFENEGRKIAWRIHGVDELIAGKKNTMKSRKKGRR
ncbi:MAG: hypothetical protein GY721_10555 [Deltaproteobacteria bacterium]|nr:hypothetical protein [Deltaproteobacteria bacterium]